MLEKIAQWIGDNKEWLFSGIVPTAIAFALGFVCNYFLNKSKEKKKGSIQKHCDSKKTLSLESCFLLIYAANDDDHIIKAYDLGNRVIISTKKRAFMKDISPRESAIWQDALDILIENGYVRLEKKANGYELYGLTGEGYRKGEELKVSMNVSTDNEPKEELDRKLV